MPWDDFSEHVVHFTKKDGNRDALSCMLGILGGSVLQARNGFGVGRSIAPDTDTQKTVCFSEIPLHCLKRISDRRSHYGIGFTKDFARRKGALPIWYAEYQSTALNAVQQLMNDALISASPSTHPIWQITPFVDAPGEYPHGRYRFEWEREWRCVGNFRFDVSDVAFLIMPDEQHVRAVEFFREARAEQTGPCYECPYIDSTWSLDEITKAIDSGWPHEQV